MTAKLEICDGPHARRVFQFDKGLCRIGSSPQSQFRVEGIDEHVATVHFRDGQYFVINRCDHAVRLGRRSLEPDASAVWSDQQVLRIDDEFAVVLDTAGGQPPAVSRHVPIMESQFEDTRDPDGDASTEPKKPNRLRQFVIVGLSVLGMILLLIIAQQITEMTDQEYFDKIVTNLALEVSSDDIRMRTVFEGIKSARALECQERYDEAAAKYQKIRDTCLKRDSRHEATAKEIERHARHFIACRLEALGAD